jgi:hypothetical protein
MVINGRIYNNACDRCCKHKAMHVGSEDLCCRCHVEQGGIPADWHSVCVSVYKQKTETTNATTDKTR